MDNILKSCVLVIICASAVRADTATDFVIGARSKHGKEGAAAARFLIEHMPQADRKRLDADFLEENLDLALRARSSFPWAAQVPKDLFFNDVLPYAVIDESRDPWRASYFEMASNIVAEAHTATEAVQRLNRDFFNVVNVHYSTKRNRPNQSPFESAAQGMASCTGLSIILVDACRAVGIPARIVGTPLWTNQRGNHTWVEFWDGDWHFVGADEYDANGVDRGWFTDDAARAIEDEPLHAIYATSWEKTGLNFPMVWAPDDQSVPGINVTDRYAKQAPLKNTLGIRLYSTNNRRTALEGMLLSEDGDIVARFKTRDETVDLNDMPELEIVPGNRYRIQFRSYQTELFVAAKGASTMDVHPQDLAPLPKRISKSEVPGLIEGIYAEMVKASLAERKEELEVRQITLEGNTLKWKESIYGTAPESGRSLWISMHGGGNCPAELNDQQWENQAKLYEPKEGIYIAPRAPNNDWDLWHKKHIDPLFERLIENCIAVHGVNPDKVYLMGYSAGGDGVWQLAPRMADRFAAAAMMAGHPNDASLLGLRNLPFATFVGAEDAAYERNKIVAEKAEQLEKLHKHDPGGYVHLSRVYSGQGHWMDRKDEEALPWMADYARNPWPDRIVWFQDDVTHDRFYWIRLPNGTARQGDKIVAVVNGQQIDLTGNVPSGTRIRLSDQLLDLDKPIMVTVNGTRVCERIAKRSPDVIRRTLEERLDPAAAACAEIVLVF